ncbi:MAG TPA: hypothetical protein VIR05_02545 [Luteimonas sp.]
MLYLAATAVGTGVTMYGQDTAANQEEANAKFAADQAEADARAEQGAAQVEAERIRREGKRQRSKAVAAAAAAGVDVDSPTALKIDQEITANAEEDALTVIANGGDRARRLNQQGQADRIAGSNAASAGKINMASTLLEGAAMTARGWKRYKEGGEG